MDNEIKISEEFILPRDLSAMAKTSYVQTEKLMKNGKAFIKKGSTVAGVKVIAVGENIREVQRLIDTFLLPNGEKTQAQDWYKCRGTAIVTDGTKEEVKEIHWYQCKNIGKVEFKTKERDEENVNQVQG